MPGLVINRFSLDTTGLSPNNLVVNEPHILANARIRAIAPIHASFFKQGVILKITSTNTILNQSQYKFYSIQALASAKFSKEIYDIILVTDSAVPSDISVTYQALGGDYTFTSETTKQLIDELYADTRNTGWSNVVDIPSTFNPVHHIHAAGDVVGFDYVVAALERIANTIAISTSRSADEIYTYLETRLTALSAINAGIAGTTAAMQTSINAFLTHISRTDNPHGSDKAQIGLPLLQNYGTATLVQLQTPVVGDPKYVTNIVLSQYLTDFFAAYDIQIQNQFVPLTTSVTVAQNEANQALSATANLSSSQTQLSALTTQTTTNANSIGLIDANLEDSRIRAAAVMQNYIDFGN